METEFKQKCEECLPSYIMIDNIIYGRTMNKLLSFDTYRINYAEINNHEYNWDNQLLDLFYDFNKFENFDNMMADCLTKLNDFNYEVVDELPPRICTKFDVIE